MCRVNFRLLGLLCVLAVASAAAPVHAETEPGSGVVASATLDKQKLIQELQEIEEEYERVRRTQGEGGLRRKGLKQKLEREKSLTEFHLQLIERLEGIERRLNALETRNGGR